MNVEAESISDEINIRVAHWHVNSWGGAEYLVTKLAEAVGTDQVYTLGEPDPNDSNPYGDVTFSNVLEEKSVIHKVKERFGRLFEYGLWEDIDWQIHGDPDVLITSGATTRSAITSDDVLHLNYCHSPPRWFYDLYHERKNSLVGKYARPVLRYLRTRDVSVDPRVDYYLANSPIIKRRIWKYYKRDATILYPPVEIDSYEKNPPEDFYLHIGRLDLEKGVPSIIEAFSNMDKRLVLIGPRGNISKETFKQIRTSDNFEYRGFVEESTKLNLLSRCRAVLFNGQNEDFGIVPIEANASGKACLVPDEGFPGIYVKEGVNGIKHDRSPAGIIQAIERFEKTKLENIQASVSNFSDENFKSQLNDFLREKFSSFQLSHSDI